MQEEEEMYKGWGWPSNLLSLKTEQEEGQCVRAGIKWFTLKPIQCEMNGVKKIVFHRQSCILLHKSRRSVETVRVGYKPTLKKKGCFMNCRQTVTLGGSIRVKLTTGEELPLSTKTKRERGDLWVMLRQILFFFILDAFIWFSSNRQLHAVSNHQLAISSIYIFKTKERGLATNNNFLLSLLLPSFPHSAKPLPPEDA